MPLIIDRLVAPEPPAVLGDHVAALADDDTVGIGVDLDRTPKRACRHRVLVVVKPDEQRLRDGRGECMEAVERGGRQQQQRRLLVLEYLGDGPLPELGMAVGAGMLTAAVKQPRVQLLKAGEAQPRREEALADNSDLILDLTLLSARRRRAGGGLD